MFNAVTRLWQSVRTYIDRSHAIRELNAMDDHSLADLGIARHQIADYVHGRIVRTASGATRVAPRVVVSNPATTATAANDLRHAA